ncbi:MAG TPA: glycosyltransferase, partial [Terriglobales bacterium]|nr:glycosyltransferase [Terriglobales bacterium]
LYGGGNISQLSGAIQFLRDRPELARSMGEAGRELMRQRHDPERHLCALSEIYETIANTWARVRIQSRPLALSPQRSNVSSSPPLKIAYIGGRGVIGKYSGIETYYEETGKRLARMGHQVTIYCRTRFTPAVRQHNGMRIVRLPTVRSKHLETLIHTVLSTAHACFSGHDVVHYQALGPSLFSFVPRLFGKKTLVTVQGLDWQRKKWSLFARWVLRAAEWTSARLPNRTVVVSRTLQERFLFKYRKRCAYVPNGTQLSERTSGTYLSQFGFIPKQYVLFLGRFSPEKNCMLLIDAFENIQSNMKLVLAGGSSYTDEYTGKVRSRESEKIKVLEWVSGDRLQELLTNAALFVLPSEIEGLSLSLLEAMGAGLCVLASDIPENRELIADCGFTFSAGDANDLAKMLSVLLTNPGLRDEAGKKARIRIEQNYLWDNVTRRIDAVYREVLADSNLTPKKHPRHFKKSA